ncbi:MAG TPA: putative glycoside hydrolase [Candidatus Magasanikbacteria bacterium]|nr:putative glycoside hydrolase [Candidatus Magasanikbacteria bacterium]
MIKEKYNKRLLFFIFLSCLALGVIFWQWSITKTQIKETESVFAQTINEDQKQKPPQQTVKAIYLTAYSAGNSKKIDSIIDLIEKTELNAVVIDIKDYSGLVLYDTQVELAKKLGLKDIRIKNLPDLIQKLHEKNIYVIARQTVFQDPVLAEKRPEWALKNKTGQIWRDRMNLAWVDMSNKYVWAYNLQIAQEATDLGFDEINFDYIRFPSDGNIKNIVYNTPKSKFEVMADFFKFLNQEMTDAPVWLSVDLFGLTMEHTDDLGIGQRIVDAVDQVDYICPMMYPSHYFPGHLNFNNPADHPQEIIAHGLEKGLPWFENKRAKLRPWLQAFNMGAVYDAEKIRLQIDEVEKKSSDGWMLWNASNNYTTAGLKLE